MSIMTRKNTSAQAKQRALDTASQVVPMAKNAGLAARQSAEDAVAWAAPHVKDARSWAAPHVEQAGLAVRDKIAPAISEKIAPTISSALVEAAHRLDDTQTRRRRWPKVLAGIAMFAAVGSAIAAAVLRRRRPDFADLDADDSPAGDTSTPSPASGNGTAARPAAADEESVNGRTRSS